MYEGEKKEDVVEWWEENADELPEIANLAKFLLDSPIQGASCERLFKDFARFHTKVRNRLHTSTTLQLTQIIHNIRRKYPEHNKPGSGTFTRNRMVGVDEYVREDNLLLPGSSGTTAGDTQEEEDDKQNEEDNLCRDQNENEIVFLGPLPRYCN